MGINFQALSQTAVDLIFYFLISIMQKFNTSQIDELVSLLWGKSPSVDVFKRWSQGM